MTPLAPAVGEAPGGRGAVAAADHLVGVGHRDERERPAARRRSARSARSSRRTSRRPRRATLRGALEGGAVGQRIGVRQADLEQVGAGVGRGQGDRGTTSRRRGSPRRRTGSARPGRRRRARSNAAGDPSGAGRRRSVPGASAGAVGAGRARGIRTAALERGEVLVAATAQPERTTVSSGYGAPEPSIPARSRGRTAKAWAVSRAGRMPSTRATASTRGERLGVGGRRQLDPPGGDERGDLRPDARVVEAGRDRVGLDDLAVAILEHQRAAAVEDARRARRPAPPRGGRWRSRRRPPRRRPAGRSARR